jgi:hypothetical protein
MLKVTSYINYLMVLLFSVAAMLQYNDPDGFIWFGLYGLAALFSVLWSKNRVHRYLMSGLAIGCLVWSVTIMPASSDQPVLDSFKMQSLEVEEMRESMGLLIIAAWLLILSFLPKKQEQETVVTAD